MRRISSKQKEFMRLLNYDQLNEKHLRNTILVKVMDAHIPIIGAEAAKAFEPELKLNIDKSQKLITVDALCGICEKEISIYPRFRQHNKSGEVSVREFDCSSLKRHLDRHTENGSQENYSSSVEDSDSDVEISDNHRRRRKSAEGHIESIESSVGTSDKRQKKKQKILERVGSYENIHSGGEILDDIRVSADDSTEKRQKRSIPRSTLRRNIHSDLDSDQQALSRISRNDIPKICFASVDTNKKGQQLVDTESNTEKDESSIQNEEDNDSVEDDKLLDDKSHDEDLDEDGHTQDILNDPIRNYLNMSKDPIKEKRIKYKDYINSQSNERVTSPPSPSQNKTHTETDTDSKRIVKPKVPSGSTSAAGSSLSTLYLRQTK